MLARPGEHIGRVVKPRTDNGLGVFKEMLGLEERQQVVHHVAKQRLGAQLAGRLKGGTFHKVQVERDLVGQLDDLPRRLGFVETDINNVDVRGVADERILRQRRPDQQRSHHVMVRLDPLGYGVLGYLVQSAARNSHKSVPAPVDVGQARLVGIYVQQFADAVLDQFQVFGVVDEIERGGVHS